MKFFYLKYIKDKYLFKTQSIHLHFIAVYCTLSPFGNMLIFNPSK